MGQCCSLKTGLNYSEQLSNAVESKRKVCASGIKAVSGPCFAVAISSWVTPKLSELAAPVYSWRGLLAKRQHALAEDTKRESRGHLQAEICKGIHHTLLCWVLPCKSIVPVALIDVADGSRGFSLITQKRTVDFSLLLPSSQATMKHMKQSTSRFA